MKDNNNIEIWGDAVSLKDLVLSIIISVVATMGGYFIAPSGDSTKQLFFGLLGAVIGFTIATVLIKPKRMVTEEEVK